jgi:integrase
LFFNWCIEKSYIKENPTKGILRKKNVQKKRTIIEDRKTEIFEYLENMNYGYYTICMLIYFCFIRKTEITKLKVKDVDLDKNIIYVSGEISKNGKSEIVTIPATLKIILEKHLTNANKNDFLFSQNNYAPGSVQLKPKKISDEWVKVRKALNLPETLQFYSLKDSGITDMFKAGIPNIKIRDQARHHDIKMTETYTQRNKKADDDILNFK